MNTARHPTSAHSAAPRPWMPALAAALVWGGLALSAGYWGLRWWGEAPSRPLPPPPLPALNIDSQRVATALGARPDAAPVASAAPVAGLGTRLQLVGVVADRDGRGAALLGVDGQPPRPYRVGAQVLEGVRVLAVGPRHAEVGGDTGRTRLSLPDKPAATAGAAAVKAAGLVRP